MSTSKKTELILRLSRRDFLRLSGATTVLAAAAPGLLAGCADRAGEALSAATQAIDLTGLEAGDAIELLRAEDLLVLELSLVNLGSVGSPPMLARTGSGPALMVLTLPSQHVLEEAWMLAGSVPPKATSVARTALSRKSRLVFSVLDPLPPVPFTTAGLLELLNTLGLNVNSNAAEGADPGAPGTVSGGSRGAPRPLHPLETAIELPFRVQLSPNQYARFRHAGDAVAVRGRYELWHTRLGTSAIAGGNFDALDADRRTARALWTRDGEPGNGTLPAVYPLTVYDRRNIVKATSDFSIPGAHPAIRVKQLALTPLGGTIDAELDVPEPPLTSVPPPLPGSNLERWAQRSSLGRDSQVEVVYRGFLFPFGHKVSLQLLTERRFPVGNGTAGAFLFKSAVLVVREAFHEYPEHADLALQTLTNPFRSIRLLTLRSPVLDGLPTGDLPFVPRVGGRSLRFDCEATDRHGRTMKFSPGVLWVPESGQMDIDWFNQLLMRAEVRDSPTGGQRFALARCPDAQDQSTTFEIKSLDLWGTQLPTGGGANPFHWPPFCPKLTGAQLSVDAVRALSGAAETRSFEFTDTYQAFGFDLLKNPRQIFLQLGVNEPAVLADFSKQADKAGGFMTPSLAIRGLSRLTGPVSEISDLPRLPNTQVFNEEIAGALPKLFGCIELKSILGDDGTLDEMMPRFVSEALNAAERFLADGNRVVAGLQSLATGLNPAGAAQEVSDHAQEIRQQAQALADGLVTGLPQLAGLAQHPTDLEDTLDRALGSMLADIAKLHERLGDPRYAALNSKLAGLVPSLDVTLRTSERLLRSLRDLGVGVRQAFIDFNRGLDLIRDGNVRLEWRPPIRKVGVFDPTPNGKLVLSADLRTRPNGGSSAGMDLVCSLDDFKIVLPIVELPFKKLQFRQRSGKKPEIDVVMGKLAFLDCLKFVEALKDIIPGDGFSDPPHVEVTPSGLTAGYSLALPSVAVGVFSLEHMAISASLEVPFLGDSLAFRFGFCSRENPFVVTVAMLGGGGYFGVTVSPKGVIALEAAIEFGARLSVNFVVASGSVEVMAGLYFGWFQGKGPKLSGYLRIRGEVDVLGLISASVELRMTLDYWPAEGKCIGHAELEIEISIGFFSTSAKLECERRFAGSNEDPTFYELVGDVGDVDQPHPWLDYWEAFAA